MGYLLTTANNGQKTALWNLYAQNFGRMSA